MAMLLRPGIARVFSATCHECDFHDSLHTCDRHQAQRTARELGWVATPEGLLCPSCAPAKPARRKGVAK